MLKVLAPESAENLVSASMEILGKGNRYLP